MVSKDQAIGWIILIVCIIVIIGYPTALYVWPEWQFILVAVPVTIAIILVFAIGAWIGWTMATTPTETHRGNRSRNRRGKRRRDND